MASDGAQDAAPDPQKGTSTSLRVASAGHEVNNFAESLTNLVYLLQRNPNLDDDARKYVHLIEGELEHMRYVITQMLARYREIANPAPVSVSSVLDTVLQFHAEKIASKNIQVEKRYECDGTVKADCEDLREVFSNLVVNALQALHPKGKLSVHISQWHHGSNPKAAGVQVVVADNGVGIAPEHQNKVFRQSFTTKGKKGNGLGLWMASKIVQQHGGAIHFRSSSKKGRAGTAFSVFLPAELPANQPARVWRPTPENILTSSDNRMPTPESGQMRILSPKENRAIARRLQAENCRLLAAIRAKRKRFQLFKLMPISRQMV